MLQKGVNCVGGGSPESQLALNAVKGILSFEPVLVTQDFGPGLLDEQ